MSGVERVERARERARTERRRAEKKVEAFEQFADRIESIRAERGRAATTAATATATTAVSSVRTVETATGATDRVREAFDRTVRQYSDAETLLEGLSDELSPDLAASLSPAGGPLTPELKRTLLDRAAERERECGLVADAIDSERARLDSAHAELAEIRDWLAAADETPLLQLSFENLRDRHDRLTEFRATCDRIAADRQSYLDGTTHRDGLTGVRERNLAAYLYDDLAVDHPVLAAAAELDATLDDCQRAVRRHLTARV